MIRSVLLFISVVSFSLFIYQAYFTGESGLRRERIARMEKALQREIESLKKEMSAFAQGEQQDYQFPIFHKKNGEIIRWTSHLYFPESTIHTTIKSSGIELLSSDKYYYLVCYNVLPSGMVIGYLPIFQKYNVSNQYLKPTWNKAIFDEDELTVYTPGFSESIPVHVGNLNVFNVPQTFRVYSPLLLTYGAFAFLSLFVLLLYIVWSKHETLGVMQRFLLLIAGLLFIRFLMNWLSFPNQWTASPIFNPKYFASSVIHPSLADLFINVTFLGIIAFFFYRNRRALTWSLFLRLSLFGRNTFFFTATYFALLIPLLCVDLFYNYSTVSLDITESLHFDFVRVLSFLTLLVSVFICYLLLYVSIRSAYSLTLSITKRLVSILVATCLFALFSLLDFSLFQYALYTGFALLIINFVFIIFSTDTTTRYVSLGLLIVLLALGLVAIQHMALIKKYHRRVAFNFLKNYSQNFIARKDVLQEYMLQECMHKIQQDVFIQSRFSLPVITRRTARQRILQYFLNQHFNQFDIKIYFLDDVGKSIEPDYTRDWLTENNMLPRDYLLRVYTSNNTLASFRQYELMIPIRKNSRLQGFVLVDLYLKNKLQQSVFPELLSDAGFSQYNFYRDVSYAVYVNNRIQYTHGSFNYEKQFSPAYLQHEKEETTNIIDHSLHFIHSNNDGSFIVLTLPDSSFYALFTNGSLVFMMALGVIILYLTGQRIVQTIRGVHATYAQRIELYAYIFFVIPLAIFALVGVLQINRLQEQQIKLDYNTHTVALAETISELLDSGMSWGELMHNLSILTRNEKVDFSIYSTAGKLISTSQPLMYQSQLLSERIYPFALENSQQNKEDQFTVDEQIGELRYKNVYKKIRSAKTGEQYGILSVPFFESVYSLEKIRISIFSSILITFTIILIIFMIISNIATRWLTYPLSWVTETLRKTSWDKNKKLSWEGNDEIGAMVGAYNHLVENLEQNKMTLARHQREIAWRDIAQQVAHEIKNPLTPIKLTLQQMQRNIHQDKVDKEKNLHSVENILQQVSILDEIATSFSSFAKMPTPVLQAVNLNDLLQKIIMLYSAESPGRVRLLTVPQTLTILADEPLLFRILSNIVLNALQSGGDRATSVIIGVVDYTDFLVISFSDDGDGIPSELHERIFIPHFTTKETGSGLGLAICKQGLEQMNASIWFDTEVGKGTTFYVKFLLGTTNETSSVP